ncbi:hypothetical protein ASD83_15630 [Devosia sp. Root685]|nr:hypothetical protein ASD83_15630 [Devosia sp. Root685]
MGLSQSGFTTQVAVEQDKWAAETFSANFPDASVICDDIEHISEEQIKALCAGASDLIAGGPPCQGFSHSNIVNRDPKDPRNSLFLQFLRWVDIIRPKFFLIENVVGLLSAKTAEGRYVIDVMQDAISDISYVADWRILQASDFGVPQSRQRLFIVGASSSTRLRKFEWPKPMPVRAPTLWEAISDLSEMGGQYLTSASSDYQRRMRDNSLDSRPTAHEPMRHTSRIIERFREIGYGQSEATVPLHLQPVRRGGEGLGSAFSQNSRRQHPDRPCSTIVASSHSNFIHPYYHRNFTVRELMRIQSFPDSFEVRGKRAVLSKRLSIKKGLFDDVYLDQRMQIGNAVPPLLAAALGESISQALISTVEISSAA